MDIISILAGTVLGFLSGLGTGGGSLLILWLTGVAGFQQEQARIINLMFFVPAALVASLFHRKQGKIIWQITIPAAISGSIAAAAISLLQIDASSSIIRILFGILLIYTGLTECFYRERKFK